jgi:membrane associated rhomboid family serine protease
MKATKQTLGIIATVFIAQFFSISLIQTVSLDFYTFAYPIINTDPWTIVLNIYSHAGIGHLISNAIALIILGFIVERVTTPIRFHIFFVLTGIIAALTEITFWFFVGPSTSVLGASGAIFGLMGYAVTGNNLADSFIETLNLGRTGTLILFAGLATLVTLATASEGVAIIAHATGFFIGAISGYFKLLHIEK